MRVISLFSGGKDSCYATYLALKRNLEIFTLISVIPESPESWMFHYPNVEWTHLQAEAMDLPLIKVYTKGEKEKELEDLKSVLVDLVREAKVEGVIHGGVASNYQKSRIDRLCKELKLKSIAPLWGRDPEELLKEMLEEGFKFILTGCYAEGLDKSWLGKVIEKEDLRKLMELKEKYGIHLGFEGGEAETMVLDAPFFKKRVKILKARVVKEGEFSWRYVIEDATLEGK